MPENDDSGSIGILPIPYGKICNTSRITYEIKIIKK